MHFVDRVCRRTLDGIHDRGERINFPCLLVDQRRENHGNMIRHHHRDAKVELCSIVAQTAFQHDGRHTLRKNPTSIGAECHEMLLVIASKMRKLPAIKSLRTAEGGCPHIGSAGCQLEDDRCYLLLAAQSDICFRREADEGEVSALHLLSGDCDCPLFEFTTAFRCRRNQTQL